MFLFFCLMATRAIAGDPDLQREEYLHQPHIPKIQGRTLLIEGRIDSHIYDYLAFSYQKLSAVDTVEFDSYGGNLEWAGQIAKKLETLKIKTRLSAGRVCASACVFLFGAGVVREADEGAWFGIHGARIDGGRAASFEQKCLKVSGEQLVYESEKTGCPEFEAEALGVLSQMTRKAFEDMEANGVSPKLQNAYFELPDDPDWLIARNILRKPDWVLTAGDALKFSLVTQLTKSNP